MTWNSTSSFWWLPIVILEMKPKKYSKMAMGPPELKWRAASACRGQKPELTKNQEKKLWREDDYKQTGLSHHSLGRQQYDKVM